jgi:hypothetical protein
LIPSLRQRSIAGQPSQVPGILIITLGRSNAFHRRRASATEPSVSWANRGETRFKMMLFAQSERQPTDYFWSTPKVQLGGSLAGND